MANKHKDDREITFRSKEGEQSFVTDLPMSVVQSLYYEITGKTENITFHSHKSTTINKDDLNLLYRKFCQTLEQYNAVGPSCSVTVSHTGDQEIHYKSWDKFSTYDSSMPEPITEIDVSFEFMISLPKVEEHLGEAKYQRYKIDMAFVSNLTFDPRQMLGVSSKFFRITPPSVFCKIEYVDYIVAKTFMHVVEDWVKSLSEVHNFWHFPNLQNFSIQFAHFFNRAAILCSLFPCYYLISYFDLYNANSFAIIAQWLVASAAIVTVMQLGFRISAEFIEHYVDATRNLSCLNLNKGDAKRYIEALANNKRAIVRGLIWLGAVVGAISINVFSQYLAKLLFN